MDPDNPVIRLRAEGTRAEFERRIDDMRTHHMHARRIACDDYEACIAAHYVARHQQHPGVVSQFSWMAGGRARIGRIYGA